MAAPQHQMVPPQGRPRGMQLGRGELAAAQESSRRAVGLNPYYPGALFPPGTPR